AQPAVRRRFAEHYLGLSEACAGKARTPDESSALEELELEFPNLSGAFVWLLGQVRLARAADATLLHGEPAADRCIRMTISLGWFLERRGLWQLARRHAQSTLEVLHRPDGFPTSAPPARLLCLY